MSGRGRLTLQAAVATIGASAALGSVFSGLGWVVPVAGAVLLVAAVCELLRRTRVAAALGPIVAAGAVLCYLTAGYASDTAYARVIPSGASLQTLADIVRAGFSDVRTMATPVPTNRGLVMLAIVGVAAVELVVDLLAVTLRRAALAGVPLLAMFVLSTSIAKGGVFWFAFVLAATGYLWLLLVDSRERIGRWGRTFGGDRTTGHVSWSENDLAPSPLSALGRRIGATAIAVGVVLPMLVPGLHGGLPKHGGGGLGGGTGSNHVVTLNPIVNIHAQLTSTKPIDLMVVRSNDPSPGYLRLTALDNFDGTTFYPVTLNAPASARVGKGINAPTLPGTVVSTKVDISGLSLHWLPVPTQAEEVNGKSVGNWLFDAGTNTIFSARDNTQNHSYTVSSIKVEPPPSELADASFADASVFARDLFLPSGIDVGVRTLAASITANATTPLTKAVAIQNYLSRAPFVYDTNVKPADSTQALTDFLLVNHHGFCQQFAASMAILARIEHIPSRVAVGFTRGEKRSDGTWVVTSHDAHAWPELYFPGFGWLPFEPTPRSDGQTVQPAFTHIATPTRPTVDQQDTPGKNVTHNDGLTGAARKQALADQGTVKTTPPLRDRTGSPGWAWPLVVLALMVAAGPALVRVVMRRRRYAADDPHALWEELRAGAIDAGVDWVDGLTPRGSGRVVLGAGELTPPAREALARVVRGEERARYAAAPTPDAGTAAGLRADVRLVVASLFGRRSATARVAARLWPRSTLRSLGAVAVRVADVLDAVDAAGVWLRRRLRGAQPPIPRSS